LAEEYVISVVLEGNAASMTGAQDKVTKGNEKMTGSTMKANVAFLANIAVFQASVAALNQVSGGLNKTAGALDKLGAKDAAKSVRMVATAFEIVAGPLEVVLAGLTFYVILTSQAAGSALGFSLANFTLAGSLWAVFGGLAAVALAAGPFLIVAGIVIMLAKHFDVLGKAIWLVTNPMEVLNRQLQFTADLLTGIIDLGEKAVSFGSDLTGGGLGRFVTASIKGGA
tara:strand:- start:4245 stop:4922 length:678 start_codon:yes stop_codon:yes gene_type:complete